MKRRNSRRARQRRAILRALIERDGPDCAWCGRPLGSDMNVLEVDHIVPAAVEGHRIRIGWLTLAHLQALHGGCNSAKRWAADLDVAAAREQVRRNLDAEARAAKGAE